MSKNDKIVDLHPSEWTSTTKRIAKHPYTIGSVIAFLIVFLMWAIPTLIGFRAATLPEADPSQLTRERLERTYYVGQDGKLHQGVVH